MTAPAAPVIRHVHHDGVKVHVRWQPVEGATDYKLYVGETNPPTGVEDDIADEELGDDGWFFAWSDPQAGVVYVGVTALNALAEESALSNVRQVNVKN